MQVILIHLQVRTKHKICTVTCCHLVCRIHAHSDLLNSVIQGVYCSRHTDLLRYKVRTAVDTRICSPPRCVLQLTHRFAQIQGMYCSWHTDLLRSKVCTAVNNWHTDLFRSRYILQLTHRSAQIQCVWLHTHGKTLVSYDQAKTVLWKLNMVQLLYDSRLQTWMCVFYK